MTETCRRCIQYRRREDFFVSNALAAWGMNTKPCRTLFIRLHEICRNRLVLQVEFDVNCPNHTVVVTYALLSAALSTEEI